MTKIGNLCVWGKMNFIFPVMMTKNCEPVSENKVDLY